jgi:hypothetical protein
MVKGTLLDELISSTAALCLLSGGSDKVYFGIGHSQEVASWLNKHSFVILGLEGFKCNGVSILPMEDFIADFSSITGTPIDRIQKSLQAAITILPQWADDVEFVEFVIENAL